jgi:hypothetical protein
VARLPRNPLQLLPASRRMLLVLITTGQLSLWRRVAGEDRPWRGRGPKRWSCIGCGRESVAIQHTYGPRCRKRLEAGLPVDLDEYLTEAEVRGGSLAGRGTSTAPGSGNRPEKEVLTRGATRDVVSY